MTSTTNKEEFSASNGSVQDRGSAQTTQPVEGQELPSTFVPLEAKPQLEGEALRAAIKKQVEYYFSKENLSKDTFLVSQMDMELFVSIDLIAGFKMLKNLTTDRELITSVMEESKFLLLDSTRQRVKPNLNAFRNTLILRDIPTDADPEEIKALFKDTGSGEPTEIRADIGDTWYVSFESEEIVLQKLDAMQGKMFKDNYIKTRIKSENIFHNWTPPQPPMPDFSTTYFQGGVPYYAVPEGWTPEAYQMMWEGQQYPRNYDKRGYRRGRRDNYRGRGYKENGGAPRKRRGSQSKPANLVPSDFPPLPGSVEPKSSGYGGENFTAYSKQQLVDIVKGISEVVKPDGLEHPVIVLEKPNTQLEITEPFPKKETAAEVARRSTANKSEKEKANEPKAPKEKEGKGGKAKESKESKEPKEGKESKETKEAKEGTAKHAKPKKTSPAHKTESSK